MIEAQMTLPDGVTPGKWRQGVKDIMTSILTGCRIYPNNRNKLPDGSFVYSDGKTYNLRDYVLVLDADMGPVDEPAPPQAPKAKRGRPKKVTQ